MEKQTHLIVDGKFVPDEELIKFADTFSRHHKEFETGTYCSDNNTYCIQYLDKIPSKVDPTARISTKTGIIQLDKGRLSEHAEGFVFYVILWCIVENIILNRTDADILTMTYYVTTGRSKKEVLQGYLITSKYAVTSSPQSTINRIEIVKEFLHGE